MSYINLTLSMALRVNVEEDNTVTIWFANETDARTCLSYLKQMLSDQKIVLLSNLFECISQSFSSQHISMVGYGWYNLNEATISLSKDGCLLKLPAMQFVC